MEISRIVIGSRGSDLALRQSEIVLRKIQSLDPNLLIEVRTIATKGDRNNGPIPLDVVGKGWFTKEIEQELLRGSIDMAVHSLKDLPEELPEGLSIGAIPAREDPRDALVSKDGRRLDQLGQGAVIGTDSLRRQVQILALRPDLVVRSIRGNVPTRLSKLQTEGYDAVVLAAAGLIRLGLQDRITHCFTVEEMAPAPGQGSLAIEIRSKDQELQKLLSAINDPATELTATAERAFSSAVGGGCKQPVGVYASCDGARFTLQAMIAPLDCSKLVRDSITGNCADSLGLSRALAERMLGRIG